MTKRATKKPAVTAPSHPSSGGRYLMTDDGGLSRQSARQRTRQEVGNADTSQPEAEGADQKGDKDNG